MTVHVLFPGQDTAYLQAAVDAGMGDGNVPEIFDYFMTLER